MKNGIGYKRANICNNHLHSTVMDVLTIKTAIDHFRITGSNKNVKPMNSRFF